MAEFLKEELILPATDDRIFKTLLTHSNAELVLIDIISTVIEQRVKSVQIRGNELATSDTEEKAQRFDVNCSIEDGTQVNVEMHCEELPETGVVRVNFINRYTYYLTDLHSSQKSVSVKYKDLVRTFQITFSLHAVFPNHSGFIHKFSLRNTDGEELTDQINMIIVELSKMDNVIKKPSTQMTDFEKWLIFFKFAEDSSYRSQINAIIKEKKEIAMAATILKEISQDENERHRIRSQRKYQTDMDCIRLTSEEIGELRERGKWEKSNAEKDAIIADKDAEIARLNAELEKRK